MKKLSPAAADDDGDLPAQVQHPFHQRHSLRLVPDDDGVEFLCDGCEVRGAGARYECERGAACNMDLHIRCALAPPLREIGGNRFVLHHRPPFAGGGGRLCDACGGAASGFVYHCDKLDHDVHPCCAGLPETFDLAGISFELRMKDDATQPQRRCALCAEKKASKWWSGRRRGVKRGCWSYHSVGGCGDDDVFLHVACARDLACDDSFTNVNVSLGKAMAARAAASETGTGSVVVDASRAVVHRGDQDIVPVKASALRALLLKGQGQGHRGRGGALGRSLRVLGFIVRVVIGVIFGDPTAMIVAAGQAIFSGG